MPTCRKDATVGTDHTVQIITTIIKRCYSTGKERYELGKQYVAERQHSTNLLANVLYSIAVLIEKKEESDTQEPDGSTYVDSQVRKYTNSPIDIVIVSCCG